jgi:hypothetical protein
MASWWNEDKKIHQSDLPLVPDCQLKGAIHIPDGSRLSVVWGERLLQIFRGMDASSLHNGHFQERIQLGSHHFQVAEHLHTIGSNVERRRDSSLLHGFVFTGCHVCQKRLCQHEPELAHHRTPSPRIF